MTATEKVAESVFRRELAQAGRAGHVEDAMPWVELTKAGLDRIQVFLNQNLQRVAV